MQTEARVGVVVDGRASMGRRHEHRHIGTAAHLAAGGFAGAVSKTCTAPLARLTILFQVAGMHSDVAALKKYSIWHEASRIVREEGFGAFWKGNLVTIVHRLPYSAISFYSYERYKKFLQRIPGLDEGSNYVGVARLLSGGLAGITAASVTYPLDVVRTRLATQKTTRYYKGIFHAVSTICRDEGVKGLYKGLGATLLGVGPSIAISFTVYESLRSHWQMERPQDSTAVVSLFSGSLSGIASSTATFPLDLIKRRMQLQGAAGTTPVCKSSITGTVRQIFQKEGLRGFYRGIVPEYLKVVPSVGIAFMTYETLKGLLSSMDEDDES
ncbi:mitochondrial substrate carrier family protein B-like [Oryza brachyantha]|uniref:mitochondrial substrate carrier family protein B-like n=1 Tax=Oryza brachyantha TaxID=4533 RepID=UPI001ADB12B5|nr:mitochondrial substrate carrier family protein B-like [Oryza brachyantha]